MQIPRTTLLRQHRKLGRNPRKIAMATWDMAREMSADVLEQHRRRKSAHPHCLHQTELRPQEREQREATAPVVPQRQEQHSGERFYHFFKPGTATKMQQRYGRFSRD